ncbi:hypothetical protein ACP275_06G207200 [Erythranthe tilingii]
MAAYASLTSLIQTIRYYRDSYSLSPLENHQILCMKNNVNSLKVFLEESPEKADSFQPAIRDVANHAENIIEYFTHCKSNFTIINWMRKATFKPELNKIATQIDTLTKEVIKDHVSPNDGSSHTAAAAAAADSSSSSRGGGPIDRIDAMVGFDDDLLAIKERLCCGNSKDNLKVIPLVGMGGIGKTTLATNAYHDPSITDHFDICAWVTVSQDYCQQKVVSDLHSSIRVLKNTGGRPGQSDDLNVYQTLKGRRYLIVMDDIWSTKVWDDVRMIFPDDNNGSRIMLTTRLVDVAVYAADDSSRSSLYQMQLMNDGQSWDLLRQKVFGDGDCPPELENTGKEIAEGCRGLPLAVVVIGGVLSTVNQTPDSWGEIAKNVNSSVVAKDGKFEEILSLSYTHLPHHLRPCFLYMGAFPEDYEIRASKLIKLWVAEGFLKCPMICRNFEEVAEGYLEELVKRSLVLVTKRKSCGRKIGSCSLHDLVRELCIKKAHQEKFLVSNTNRRGGDLENEVVPQENKNQGRVSIDRYDVNSLPNIYGSNIRTIICFRSVAISPGSLKNLKLLRVLNMVKTISSLPSLPSQLFPLRYLSLDYALQIPQAAISNLQNLQTLIILSSDLPFNIWVMPQLRHLISSSVTLLLDPPVHIVLENLQTLSGIRNFICASSTLKKIRNLKKMKIFYDEDIYGRDFHLRNLVLLRQLENLELRIDGAFYFHRSFNPAFPTSLIKLTLSGCRIRWERMTIVGSLPNLRVLNLRDSNFADGESWKTNDGEFARLEIMLIEKSQIKEWITEKSHFPRLKCLLLHHCRYLNEIPEVIGESDTLELIEIKGNNTSLVESAEQIQEEKKSLGDDDFQVRCFDF